MIHSNLEHGRIIQKASSILRKIEDEPNCEIVKGQASQGLQILENEGDSYPVIFLRARFIPKVGP